MRNVLNIEKVDRQIVLGEAHQPLIRTHLWGSSLQLFPTSLWCPGAVGLKGKKNVTQSISNRGLEEEKM